VCSDEPGTAVSRTVLVTGGSRGIGAAVVRQFATRGADVAFTFRKAADAADELIEDCRDLPGSVGAYEYDLVGSDPEELVNRVSAETGGLDTLVLNAGIWAGGRLGEIDPHTWWSVVEANLHGNARLAAAALPPLREGGNASITFISSAVGLIGFPGDTAYAAAKSGMVGLARSLAKEVGRYGMRVNVLAPGFVETDMTAQIPGSSRTKILDAAHLRRFGTAEEIARAVLFLAVDATYCTGTVLTVDGGWSL
jgi:3-oxoacyl-[acyl-carrier protein] reductase